MPVMLTAINVVMVARVIVLVCAIPVAELVVIRVVEDATVLASTIPVHQLVRDAAVLVQDAPVPAQEIARVAVDAIQDAPDHAKVVGILARVVAPDAVDVTQGATVPAHLHAPEVATATVQVHAPHVHTDAIAIVQLHALMIARMVAREAAQVVRTLVQVVAGQDVQDAQVPVRISAVVVVIIAELPACQAAEITAQLLAIWIVPQLAWGPSYR